MALVALLATVLVLLGGPAAATGGSALRPHATASSTPRCPANTYTYVNGNPINLDDPTGHDPAGPCSIYDERRCQVTSVTAVAARRYDDRLSRESARVNVIRSNGVITSGNDGAKYVWFNALDLGWQDDQPVIRVDGPACFGRPACDAAHQYIEDHPNDIGGAINLAANYCFDNPKKCAKWLGTAQLSDELLSLAYGFAGAEDAGPTGVLRNPYLGDITSTSPQRSDIPVDGGRGALNLPFKVPALSSQIDEVVSYFDEFGEPPPGVAQGGLKGYPEGTYGNKNGALPDQPLGYYTESDIWTSGNGVKRGAERLIFGDGGEVYYTNDHYESGSFVRIR